MSVKETVMHALEQAMGQAATDLYERLGQRIRENARPCDSGFQTQQHDLPPVPDVTPRLDESRCWLVCDDERSISPDRVADEAMGAALGSIQELMGEWDE